MTIVGKGYYVWQIEKCAPDAKTFVERAKQAGLQHVLIKIADGDSKFPLPAQDADGSKERMTRETIQALKQAGIQVVGWSFVYGTKPDPVTQACVFAERLKEFDLRDAVVNAEKMPNRKWTASGATTFMKTFVDQLKQLIIGDVTIALSSYRFPSYHPDFPFKEFMEYCHIAMPQVYWAAKNGGDPVKNLQDTYEEYNTRFPSKQIIPTGATYGETVALGTEKFYWEARPDQVTMFLNQASAMDFPAVNFWSWQSAWEKRGLWDAVASYPYKVEPGTAPKVENNVTPPQVTISDVNADDDGLAMIVVGGAGYQEGLYNNSTDQLARFIRNNNVCSWTVGRKDRSTAWAQWAPTITRSGEYLIEVWVPGVNATARRARYHITGVVGQAANVTVEVNQLAYSDEWVRLGIFELDGKQPYSGMVSMNNLLVGDETPDAMISFSPIRWRKIERHGGVKAGYADGFDSPVGTDQERRSNKMWPGEWVDANPFLNYYFLGYHTGADLNMTADRDRGAPCYSIADGIVTYSGKAFNRDGSVSGFGNMIIIKHDPYETESGETIVAYSRYAHMKDLLVSKGQRVKRGDKLATIWNVGTQAHHLHFDISTTGMLESYPGHWPGSRRAEVEKHYVDPAEFIKKYRPKI